MLTVTSSAFSPNGDIPSKYTCDGYGVSPPLAWTDEPPETKSFAILVDDPDSDPAPFLHWLVTDIPAELHELREGAALPRDANVVETDAGTLGYYGPCPVEGKHRYRFHVFALDTTLGRAPENREDFMNAIDGHVLDEGELVAAYERMHRAQGPGVG